MASKHQPFVAGVEKIKSIKLQMLLDAELSDFYMSVYKISKRNIDCDWLNVAVISALLLRGRWRRLSLRPILELLPACPSPHRSPDWSNRPWTPRPSGPRCGPEISQTPNDSTASWGWTNRNTGMVAVEDSDHEIHSMQGDDEDMEDEGTHIYGCLDNVATHTQTPTPTQELWCSQTVTF